MPESLRRVGHGREVIVVGALLAAGVLARGAAAPGPDGPGGGGRPPTTH